MALEGAPSLTQRLVRLRRGRMRYAHERESVADAKAFTEESPFAWLNEPFTVRGHSQAPAGWPRSDQGGRKKTSFL